MIPTLPNTQNRQNLIYVCLFSLELVINIIMIIVIIIIIIH